MPSHRPAHIDGHTTPRLVATPCEGLRVHGGVDLMTRVSKIVATRQRCYARRATDAVRHGLIKDAMSRQRQD